MRNLVIILLIFLLVILFFGVIHYRHKYYQVVDTPFSSDTIKLVDTIRVEIPVPKEIKLIKTDTVYLPSIDDKDSVNVLLPITEKVYGDSTFRAVISGYKPHLESLIFYPTTTTITEKKVIKTSENGFKISPSIGVGYGVIHNNIDMYVGFSLRYEF